MEKILLGEFELKDPNGPLDTSNIKRERSKKLLTELVDTYKFSWDRLEREGMYYAQVHCLV